MVSPRERSRPARRRIAGERSRPAGAAPAPEAPEHAAPEAPEHAAPEAPEHAATEPAPEPVPEPEPEPGRAAAEGRAPARRPALVADGGPATWVLAVLAGLLVAALALDGFLVWKQQRDQEAAARALHGAVTVAPSVAERAAEAVLSFRHDTIEQDSAQARRFLTDDYAPAYISSINDVVAGPAAAAQATVEAQVLASGVSDASAERANVLLFVNQTTTSASQVGQTALNRVVLTMVPRQGTWKVDEIRAF